MLGATLWYTCCLTRALFGTGQLKPSRSDSWEPVMWQLRARCHAAVPCCRPACVCVCVSVQEQVGTCDENRCVKVLRQASTRLQDSNFLSVWVRGEGGPHLRWLLHPAGCAAAGCLLL